jgi:hypothetical protein
LAEGGLPYLLVKSEFGLGEILHYSIHVLTRRTIVVGASFRPHTVFDNQVYAKCLPCTAIVVCQVLVVDATHSIHLFNM